MSTRKFEDTKRNQKPSIKDGQTIQWAKVKGQKMIQVTLHRIQIIEHANYNSTTNSGCTQKTWKDKQFLHH